MARTLIKAPASARRGEIIAISTIIGHPMETGFRPGADGQVLPRDIIQHFTCHYNDELVFSAELFSAIAANPLIAFHTVATTSGTLRFSWEGDHGFRHTESVTLNVT
ncbi:MAG: thiosulfate oxidation carrier complex protein SoxZ [Burkholderiales bacterium]|nr:thiosulfate oxidation carrier complex protein SoxZ [Burkholderiales bacterium]